MWGGEKLARFNLTRGQLVVEVCKGFELLQ